MSMEDGRINAWIIRRYRLCIINICNSYILNIYLNQCSISVFFFYRVSIFTLITVLLWVPGSIKSPIFFIQQSQTLCYVENNSLNKNAHIMVAYFCPLKQNKLLTVLLCKYFNSMIY